MKLLFSLSLIVIFLLLIVKPVHAAGGTITVMPQLTQIDLNTDSPTAKIQYTNNTGTTIELALSVENVTELEDRNPVGILDPKDSQNYKYSLSSWVDLSTQTLILNPGESKEITVNVNKEKLSPGGHYGSILAEIEELSDNKKIKVTGVLASLLFVRASTGNEIEEAKLPFFGLSEGSISFPDAFIMRFQNTGNVDLTPYGLLEIKDLKGKTVAKGIVNEDSLITLPEAIRTYTIPVNLLQKIILPGKYTALLSIHYGKSHKTIASHMSFWTLGTFSLSDFAAFFVVFAGAFLIVKKLIRMRKAKKTTNP